jgi:hypothetical protein
MPDAPPDELAEHRRVRCPGCLAVLGEIIDPDTLRINGVVIRARIALYCWVCRARKVWTPAKEHTKRRA